MQLHQIHGVNNKGKKRVGRGGKRGTTAGRGTKGQKSRSGRRIRPAYRDLIQRIPKKLGFGNREKSSKPLILNLEKVEKIKKYLETKKFILSKETIKGAGIIPLGYNGEVKILGRGKISFPATVKGIKVSDNVKKKIEENGGKIV